MATNKQYLTWTNGLLDPTDIVRLYPGAHMWSVSNTKEIRDNRKYFKIGHLDYWTLLEAPGTEQELV